MSNYPALLTSSKFKVKVRNWLPPVRAISDHPTSYCHRAPPPPPGSGSKKKKKISPTRCSKAKKENPINHSFAYFLSYLYPMGSPPLT